MDRSYVAENNKSRERLRKLVAEITDEELQLVIYKEGWTVAVMLAHLAYWDRWALLLMEKWTKTGEIATPITDWAVHNDTFFPNDTILTFLLAIPPRTAARMAVSAAEEIDRKLEQSPPEMVAKIESLGDNTRLNRAIHRKMHLDEIDVLLKAKRGR